jgi:predicted dehydrogenase
MGDFKMKRPLRMALVGGGPGSFIGAVHRIAAELDGEIRLVAGAFSSDPARSQQAGAVYGVDPARAYPTYQTMLAAEAGREDRADFVTIATPNDTHLPIACAALSAGFSVMSDKPATASFAEVLHLSEAVRKAQAKYAITFTYSGYPLVREARRLVVGGELGTVRKVVAEYSQGWLASPIERQGNKQAQWRTDPARTGLGGCIGDIGVHAFHLAEFVTGLEVSHILPDLGSVVEGRVVDDDCNVLLRFKGGSRGVICASQIAIGDLNALRLRVYGSQGSLDWSQENPNSLLLHHANGRSECLRTADASVGADAAAATRLPGGHPEGYLEAFANLYRDLARVLRGGEAPLLPGIAEGIRSMRFIERAVSASRNMAGWVALD